MNLTPSYKPEHRTVIDQFIKTKVRESGASGVILGLSGGLDSAVTAVLAAEALGEEMVHCLIMPYEEGGMESMKATGGLTGEGEEDRGRQGKEGEGGNGDQESTDHAVLIAEKFGLNYEILSIRRAVDQVLELADLSDVQRKVTTTASGNIRARIRMVTLYYHANLNNYLVLGTSNKSEVLVGYFTKYGDGGSDAMPIGDLYKTQVFALAKELGIPDIILQKPPTAGLVPGQTDEGDLGLSYSELDRILFGIERWLDLEDIAGLTGIDLSTVQRIQHRVHTSSHKRYLGMIPKIGLRTPGFDWRENVSLLSFSRELPDEK